MRAKNQAYAEDRRELEEGEYITACTEACPAKAITFGDLNNPEHEVTRLKQAPFHVQASGTARDAPQGLLPFQ